MPLTDKRMLVVSNRLPARVERENGEWVVHPGAGGLVTAMTPLMKENRGIWLGWPGSDETAPAEELLRQYSAKNDYEVVPVMLTEEEVQGYYRGFANQTIWPLFHDLLGHCSFDARHWRYYVDVNRRFAEKVSEVLGPNTFTWIHDYQLILLGQSLRQLGVRQHLSFFLHIPFPAFDLIRRLPWRNEIMEALLDYDHIGFQTAHDRRNFIQCVRWFVPDAKVQARGRESFLRYRGRTVRLGFYPISIDFKSFADDASMQEAAEAAWYLHENFRSRTLVLGLDRLDYTKGMPHRMLAFERLLEKYEELRGQISLIQVVIPSRVKVPQYQDLKEELDTMAGRINGKFSAHGWVPIHYMYRSLDRVQLLGHYRACEIALVTPLRDGMNLVAKEYCASSVDNNGVLILSEFAGAIEQLGKHSLVVNPYDVEATADAIYQAYVMGAQEREHRMKLLRAEVRRNDVHRWVRWFIGSEDLPRAIRPTSSEPTPQPSE